MAIMTDALELVFLVGMELVLVSVAICTFLLFSGAPVQRGAKKVKKIEPEEETETPAPADEEETQQVDGAKKESKSQRANIVFRQAKLIRELSKKGDLQGAVNVFNKLRRAGLAENHLAYNSLLNACVENGNMQSAIELFNQARTLGVTDMVSYNILIKGHLAAGNGEAAGSLIADMRERGLPSSEITYNGLLHTRVLAGDHAGAWRVMEDMKAAGVAANAVTCSILMRALTPRSSEAEVMRTMELVDGMEGAMDEVLFGMMVEACIRTKRFDLITRRLDGAPLSAPTCGSLIKAHGQMGDVSGVWQVWHEMTKKEVQPTPITFGCMIEALVMNQRTEDARDLVEQIWTSQKDQSLVNTVIYSTMLKGFARAKQPERVMALYDEMRERGIACNTITYNTVLNACSLAGALHNIPRLLTDMHNASPSIEPDIVTYSTLVKAYCVSGDVSRAFEVFREMKRSTKFSVDEVLYNTLLDGCAKERRLNDALELMDDMRRAGVPPSNYTLSILLKILGRCKRLDQAFTVLDDVCKEFNFRPNIQVYTCLMQACFQNRQTARAIALHDRLVHEGCSPDAKTYSVLARGCLQAGATDKAVEVVRCAHHLPGHSLLQTSGRPVGIDRACLDDVLTQLGRGSTEATKLQEQLRRAGR